MLNIYIISGPVCYLIVRLYNSVTGNVSSPFCGLHTFYTYVLKCYLYVSNKARTSLEYVNDKCQVFFNVVDTKSISIASGRDY